MYEIEPKNDFLVGIDSDGCAFDTMELKQKECFIPVHVRYWKLQGISKYLREAAEFVNLYSKSRGANRFPAMVEVLQWLKRRPEVRARGVEIDIPSTLIDWIERETKLGNDALIKEVERTDDPGLKFVLEWSYAVNEAVEQMNTCVPPFPYVRESLQRLQGKADILVVSATPNGHLQMEWDESDITQYVVEICGQEAGSKKESLQNAAKYAAGHTLMIGDAPGDYRAAVANDALFFPINPGAEEASWQRFYEEGIDRFLEKTFAGDYQDELLAEFDSFLPELPPWPVEDA